MRVKNNLERFKGEDFMFQLTNEEMEILNLRCKNCTSSLDDSSNWGGLRYLPHAFTESGIYMLMTVLKAILLLRLTKENLANYTLEM